METLVAKHRITSRAAVGPIVLRIWKAAPVSTIKRSDSVSVIGGRARLDYIDMLRALAVLAVFSLHVGAFWRGEDVTDKGLGFVVDRLAAQGAAGVDLFIVLSGFCMMYPLVRGRGDVARLSAPRFYRRRAVRLLPAYYAALGLVLAALTLPELQRRLVGRPVEVWDVVTHVLLIQPFDPQTLSAVNGPLWSISLEVTLYLVFPAGLMLLERFGWGRVLGGSLALALGWFTLIGALRDGSHAEWSLAMEFWLPAHYFEFVLGMFAAHLVCHPRTRQSLHATLVLPVAAAVGAAGTVAASSVVRTVGWGIAACALTIAASGWRGHVRLRWLAKAGSALGLVSYSFYLLHQPFILLASAGVHRLNLDPLATYLLALPVGLSVMYVIARGFFTLVERPFLVAGSMRDAIVEEPR